MVTHRSTNQGRHCLTPWYQVADHISMPITADWCLTAVVALNLAPILCCRATHMYILVLQYMNECILHITEYIVDKKLIFLFLYHLFESRCCICLYKSWLFILTVAVQSQVGIFLELDFLDKLVQHFKSSHFSVTFEMSS